jgi:hypothetical protein
MMPETVNAIKLVKGRRGRARKRPVKLHADKADDPTPWREELRQRGIMPRIARRSIKASERIGRHCRVVERTLSWLNRYRRLRIRYERYHLGVPKQLITFGGEALIERTARQITERKQSRVCVVSRDPLISLPQHDTLLIPETDSLTETILATCPYWSDRNVFLLGHVFYSERAVSVILECQRELVFFGRPWPSSLVKCGHGEMFGLTLAARDANDIHNLLALGLSYKSAGAPANLWNLYQLAGMLPLGSSQYLPRLLTPIDDYTNDIDTPIDYLRRNWLYEKISVTRTSTTV